MKTVPSCTNITRPSCDLTYEWGNTAETYVTRVVGLQEDTELVSCSGTIFPDTDSELISVCRLHRVIKVILTFPCREVGRSARVRSAGAGSPAGSARPGSGAPSTASAPLCLGFLAGEWGSACAGQRSLRACGGQTFGQSHRHSLVCFPTRREVGSRVTRPVTGLSPLSGQCLLHTEHCSASPIPSCSCWTCEHVGRGAWDCSPGGPVPSFPAGVGALSQAPSLLHCPDLRPVCF